MNVLRNFWVQKRYQTLSDNQWMLFLWGFQAYSLEEALEKASKKPVASLELNITLGETSTLIARDPETDTRYVVELRDTQPDFKDTPRMSIRDETIPPRVDRKPMPSPKSLFGPAKPEHPELF